MLPPTEDPRKLEITLRHYEEDYASQAIKTAKLQAEIVHLKANVDYLQQCLAEERAQRKSDSVSVEDKQPSMTAGGALALNTPPISDRGSIARPISLEDRIQSIDMTDSPLSLHTSHAPATYSKKRKLAANRGQSHHRQPSPKETAGSPNPRKRAKSVVHVLVPPMSAAMRRAFSKAPLSAYEEDSNRRVGSFKPTSIKRERDGSIQPLPGRSADAAEHRAQQLRSPSRELSYLDPPTVSRATNATHMRTPTPIESSSFAHRPPSARAVPRNGTTTQSQDPPRVFRPLPRRFGLLRVTIPSPASSATRASADAVDRLWDIPFLDVNVSEKFLLDKTASRAQLAAVLGGVSTRTCVTVNGRHLLYPSHEFQPWRPSKPGKPGLYLYPSPEQQWQGDAQTVFVALYMAKYRYVGEYTLTAADPLSPDEFSALPPAVKQKWTGHIAQTMLFKEIRMRIATRRDKPREVTMQEAMTVANDVKSLYRGTVTAEDVLRAYENGEERMHVWRMTCIRFDEAFLKDLLGSL